MLFLGYFNVYYLVKRSKNNRINGIAAVFRQNQILVFTQLFYFCHMPDFIGKPQESLGRAVLFGLTFLFIGALSPRPTPATVLIFLDTECPVCQQYTRPLALLYKQYAGRRVQFRAIFPSITDNQIAIDAFRQTYALPFPGQPDPTRLQVRQYRATVTPEAVVLDANGRIVYRGAIDDWFVALGRHRREPTRQYLHDALDAVLENRTPAITHTEAIGCRIQ